MVLHLPEMLVHQKAIMWLAVFIFFLRLNYHICYSNQVTNDSVLNHEFVHFLHRASDSKRANLLSEHIRDGLRLHIEEHVDLNTWTQLIQFKWFEDTRLGANQSTIVSHKLTVSITNVADRKILTIYEPFFCSSTVFFVTNKETKEEWQDLLQFKQHDSTSTLKESHISTIKNILSTSKYSPYLARIPANNNQTGELWIFGISGLWINAQYPSSQVGAAKQLYRQEGYDSWKLDLAEANVSVTYNFDNALFGRLRYDSVANAEYESASLIELTNLTDPTRIDLINIIDADFHVNDIIELYDFFKLPLGYDCPTNPLLESQRLVFEEDNEKSRLLELEFIATKFVNQYDSNAVSSSEIKIIEFAKSRHPLNLETSLEMFHIVENQVRIVRDFYSRLSYSIDRSGIYESCIINSLCPKTSTRNESCDSIDINFVNGISIVLDEIFINYVLSTEDSSKFDMKLLNIKSISKLQDKFEFETSSVPEIIKRALKVYGNEGEIFTHTLSIIRIYSRRINPSLATSKYGRKGLLILSEVILMVFDDERKFKLAEIQINVVDKIQPTSFSRKAGLFDISKCFTNNRISVEVSYPIDSKASEEAEEKSYEFVEEFYRSSLNWWNIDTNEPELLEKHRIGRSLNFLRMPKVELKRTLDGMLELRILLIDKPSPLYQFVKVDEATFTCDSSVDFFLVKTPAKCADLCQLFNCGTFAFDFSKSECMLSAYSVGNQTLVESQLHDNCLLLKMKKSSSVYYLRHENEEATLAELQSYLQHHILEKYLPNTDLLDNNSTEFNNLKVINDIPLLSFRVKDWLDYSFGPPKYFTLIPSQIRISKSSFSNLQDDLQTIKVARSFRSDVVGKTYYFTQQFRFGLSDTELLEQTFIDNSNSTYYTLKRLQLVDLSSCSLICYSIKEWDSSTGSEQTCISFSYCSLEQECILLVKTDFSFTNSSIDVANDDSKIFTLTSIEQLSRTNLGCSINVRNHLTEFAGPVRIHANEDTKTIEFSKLDFKSFLEFNIEYKISFQDAQEKCAKKCIDNNRKGQKVCLAIDFCTKTVLVEGNFTYVKRKEASCILITVDHPKTSIKSRTIKNIFHTREKLSRGERLPEEKDASLLSSICNRYLTSHLLEFIHLKQTQLSQNLRKILHEPTPSMKNLDLDNCAFECSMRAPNCVIFEYCIRIERETNSVERQCSMFEAPQRSFSKKIDTTNSTRYNMSTFSKGCHIYLRSDVESIENFFVPQKDNDIDQDFFKLILPFAIIYTVILIVILFYSDVLKISALRPGSPK